jgi:hypothetical protein
VENGIDKRCTEWSGQNPAQEPATPRTRYRAFLETELMDYCQKMPLKHSMA